MKTITISFYEQQSAVFELFAASQSAAKDKSFGENKKWALEFGKDLGFILLHKHFYENGFNFLNPPEITVPNRRQKAIIPEIYAGLTDEALKMTEQAKSNISFCGFAMMIPTNISETKEDAKCMRSEPRAWSSGTKP